MPFFLFFCFNGTSNMQYVGLLVTASERARDAEGVFVAVMREWRQSEFNLEIPQAARVQVRECWTSPDGRRDACQAETGRGTCSGEWQRGKTATEVGATLTLCSSCSCDRTVRCGANDQKPGAKCDRGLVLSRRCLVGWPFLAFKQRRTDSARTHAPPHCCMYEYSYLALLPRVSAFVGILTTRSLDEPNSTELNIITAVAR